MPNWALRLRHRVLLFVVRPLGLEPGTCGLRVVQGRFTRGTVRIHPGRFGKITPYLEESLSDLVRMIPSEADSLDNSWTLLDNRL